VTTPPPPADTPAGGDQTPPGPREREPVEQTVKRLEQTLEAVLTRLTKIDDAELARHTALLTAQAVDQLRKDDQQFQEQVVDYIARLEAKLTDHLGSLGAGGEGEPEPRPWVTRAGVEDFATLAAWVDEMDRLHRLPTELWLPECWLHPSHWGIAEELHAMHAGWLEAAAKDEKAAATGSGSDALAYWYRLWMECRQRIAVTYMKTATCKPGAHQEPSAPPGPDVAAYLPAHLQASPAPTGQQTAAQTPPDPWNQP
jgi:hypothetical protein